jgi:hypothetical protein
MSNSLVGKDVDNVLRNAALRPVWIGGGEESGIGKVLLILFSHRDCGRGGGVAGMGLLSNVFELEKQTTEKDNSETHLLN